jgi:hypothetical protein
MKHKSLLAAVVVIFSAALTVQIQAGELLYGVNSGDDGLSLIDPQTGAAAFIGPLDQDADPDFNRFATPVAMAVRPSDQKIFVWNNSTDAAVTGDLLTVDPLTGAAAAFIELSSQPSISGLAFAPDGRLFGLWNQLWEINLLTGEAASIGSVGPPVHGAAFSPDGILWGTRTVSISGRLANQLVTVDTGTGECSVVAELDVDVGTTGSIVFDPSGRLLGSGFNGPLGDIIFDIDTADGSVSNIRSVANGYAPQGMGFASSYSPTVEIDIKPRCRRNMILPWKWGYLPVAVLSSDNFDSPGTINEASLTFGPTGYEDSLSFCLWRPKDVNHDGYDDLICFFQASLAEFEAGDSEGILRGETVDGTLIEGRDSVKVIGFETKIRNLFEK